VAQAVRRIMMTSIINHLAIECVCGCNGWITNLALNSALIKGFIFVLTRTVPLTPTLSPNHGGEGRACPALDTGVRGKELSILF
jgi:hypothetical protein